MKRQKILNSLNEANYAKFVTRKWKIVNDQSKTNYDVGIKITYNTEVLKFNACDYNNVYILVRGDITVIVAPAAQISFNTCIPFTKCITKVDGTTVDDAEDLDLVMPMYNLIEYSSNYSKTTGSLWFYSKDEATNSHADIVIENNFKSFEYKAKLLGNAVAPPAPNKANGILKNATFAVPLKYLSNF